MLNISESIKSTRKYDSEIEKIYHQFLIDHFYSKFETFKDSLSTEEQFQGIDGYLKIHGIWYPIDEKLQVTRIGIPLFPKLTQCFECYARKRGNDLIYKNCYRTGWYFHHNETKMYIFSYITKGTISNIEETQILCIEKEKIEQILNDYGYELRDIKSQAWDLQFDENYTDMTENRMYYHFPKCPFWLCKTKNNHLQEAPINLIVRWGVLKAYASYVYTINKTGSSYQITEELLQKQKAS